MIRIGVPSKGRLMQDTFDWFGARGLTMRRTGNDREYAGAVDGIEGVGLVLLSAPYFTALGEVVTLDMGLTFWMTLSLCAFAIAQSAGNDASRRRWLT